MNKSTLKDAAYVGLTSVPVSMGLGLGLGVIGVSPSPMIQVALIAALSCYAADMVRGVINM